MSDTGFAWIDEVLGAEARKAMPTTSFMIPDGTLGRRLGAISASLRVECPAIA